MGMNFRSCCHRCRVTICHYRNEEHLSLPRFYGKHTTCMVLNPANLQTLEDQLQEALWMREDCGYTTDLLQREFDPALKN